MWAKVNIRVILIALSTGVIVATILKLKSLVIRRPLAPSAGGRRIVTFLCEVKTGFFSQIIKKR